mgnify:CR=1 FL=1
MTASRLDRLGELCAAAAVTAPWASDEFGGIWSHAALPGGCSMQPSSFKVLDVRGWGHLQYRPDGEKIQNAVEAFVVAASPSVVAALVRVAKAALEKRDAAHAINHTVAGAWEAGCKRYDAATEALSAALSAVEGG